MNKPKLIGVILMLFVLSIPAMAVFTGQDLDVTLSNLRRELFHDYRQIDKTKQQLEDKYVLQHNRMVDIVKNGNDLSLMLYSQKQEYTFDISYALEKVSKEYRDFNKNRTPYDRIVASLDVEIDRYARLIESLRRLPPELQDLEVVPDSLAYHNDTLDAHLRQTGSLLQQELDEQVAAAVSNPAFILSESGQVDRDSCLRYASELLSMYARTREQVMADSTHYREARLRMEESYHYANDYYDILQEKVFVEGQTPWWTILAHPGEYWKQAWGAMNEKYSFSDLWKAFTDKNTTYTNEEIANNNRLTNSARMYWLVVYVIIFMLLWGLSALILLPLYRFVKPLGKRVTKEQRRYVALLLACVIFLVLSYRDYEDDIARKTMTIIQTFIGLLMAINAAMLIRLKPSKLKNSIRLYLPTIFTALFVISCRGLFVPNAFLNFFFPPLLLVMALWQLAVNLHLGRKADLTDSVVSWVSFGVTVVAMAIGWSGYIFLSLIILVWWYFQLAFILCIATVLDLVLLYKKNRLDKRVSAYAAKITFVSGEAKDQLLFGASWLYALVREVVIPLLVLGTIPTCIRWALDVFEFNDLYVTIFEKPFFRQGEFHVSLYNILFLVGMFAVFRYVNKAIHTIWQTVAYRRFLRKNNRQAVRDNEINLSLGNSLISVFIWFVYADLVILTLDIPTASLGLIAGGLSAGIGLALKDIINNFIYGIQLLSGRLRVGDFIECDGIRGKVVSINYQTTQISSIGEVMISFTNTTLFNKNFKNLTRGSAYEYVSVPISVSYGTDIQKVRELLLEASQQLLTKDKYGRDIVDPKRGVNVGLSEFGDSGITVCLKQFVLVEERWGYANRARELIYKTFNENGITIPFPQCDVHLIPPEEKD
ncbi:MAG: mechanosensitive ion channel [Bacteroidales bacterium]|nr:mechanosensitive ion channel [Bacteroidales bacterium]